MICYHRRPPGDTNGFHRVVRLERMGFRADGSMAPIVLTHEGVPVRPIRA